MAFNTGGIAIAKRKKLGKLMKMVTVRRIVKKHPEIMKTKLIPLVCKELKIHRREATELIDETCRKAMISELEAEHDVKAGRPARRFVVIPTYEETVRKSQKKLDTERW